MTTLNVTVDQLLATEINLGEDTHRNFTQCHRRLYLNLLLTEKYLTLQNTLKAQERIIQCFDVYKTLKSISSEYESSRESSYDFLKIVQLEIILNNVKSDRGLKSSLTLFRDAIENSSGDEDLKQEIIMFQIKNLLKTYKDELSEVTTIMSLFDLLPPNEGRDLVQIELFAKEIHNNLPEFFFLTQSQIVAIVSICREAELHKRGECLKHVLNTEWTMTDQEREECLASILMLSGTDLLKISRQLIPKYVGLVVGDLASKWNYVEVVLHLGDRVLALTPDTEESHSLAGGLAFLASVQDQEMMFLHFAETLLIILLKQNKVNEFDNYLSISMTPIRDRLAVKKILILRHLFEENFDFVIEIIMEILMDDSESSDINTEDILDWIYLMFPKLLQSKITNSRVIESLLEVLAAREFYHNWKCLDLSIKLALKLRLTCILTNLYINMASISFAENLDADCQVAKDLWNAGLIEEEFLLKHIFIFLSGYFMAPIDEEVKSHTLMACIPAGLDALQNGCMAEQRELLISNMGQILKEDSLNSESLPAVQIMKARLLVISGSRFQFDLQQSVSLLSRDLVGLLTFTMICLQTSDEKCQQIIHFALLMAIRVDPVEENRQLLATAALEMMSGCLLSVHAQNLVDIFRMISWTDRELVAEAMKLSWNNWAKTTVLTKKKIVTQSWSRVFTFLHNLLVDSSQQIIGDLIKPTPELLKNVGAILKSEK